MRRGARSHCLITPQPVTLSSQPPAPGRRHVMPRGGPACLNLRVGTVPLCVCASSPRSPSCCSPHSSGPAPRSPLRVSRPGSRCLKTRTYGPDRTRAPSRSARWRSGTICGWRARSGSRGYVYNPRTKGTAYVDAAKVGPSGALLKDYLNPPKPKPAPVAAQPVAGQPVRDNLRLGSPQQGSLAGRCSPRGGCSRSSPPTCGTPRRRMPSPRARLAPGTSCR